MEMATEVPKDKSVSGTKNDCSTTRTSARKDSAAELVNGIGTGAVDGEEDDDSEATEIESLPDDDKTVNTTAAVSTKVEVLKKEPRAKMSMSPNKGPMGSGSPNPHATTASCITASLASSKGGNSRKFNSALAGHTNRSPGVSKFTRLKSPPASKESDNSDNLDEEEALSDESEFNTSAVGSSNNKGGKENEMPDLDSLDNVTDAEIEDVIENGERALDEVRKILSAERRASVSPCRSDGSASSLPRRVGPRAKKSCSSSTRSSPVPDPVQSKKSTSKPKSSKNFTKSHSVGALSNYSLPLKEFEKTLGIKGQSLAKIDAKTLDKLILEKSSKARTKDNQQKSSSPDDSAKAVLPTTEVEATVSMVTNDEMSDAGESVTTECTDDTPDVIQSLPGRKKARKRRVGTYKLPGQKSKKGKPVKRLQQNFNQKGAKTDDLPLNNDAVVEEGSISMDSDAADKSISDSQSLTTLQGDGTMEKSLDSNLDESSMSWVDESPEKTGESLPDSQVNMEVSTNVDAAPPSPQNKLVSLKAKPARKKRGGRRIPWNRKKMTKKAKSAQRAEVKAAQLAASAVSIIEPKDNLSPGEPKPELPAAEPDVDVDAAAELPPVTDEPAHGVTVKPDPEVVKPSEVTGNSSETLAKVGKQVIAKFKRGKMQKGARGKKALVKDSSAVTAGPSNCLDSADLPQTVTITESNEAVSAQSRGSAESAGPTASATNVDNKSISPSETKPLPKVKRKPEPKQKAKAPSPSCPVLPKAKAGKSDPGPKVQKPKSILEGPLPNLLRKKFAQLAKARESANDTSSEPVTASAKAADEGTDQKEIVTTKPGNTTLVARVRDAERARDQSKAGIHPQHSSLTKCSNDSTYLTPSSSSSSSKSSASPSPVESLLSSSKSTPASSSSYSSKLTAAASSKATSSSSKPSPSMSKAASSSSKATPSSSKATSSSSKATPSSSKATPSPQQLPSSSKSTSSSSLAPSSVSPEELQSDSASNNCDVNNSSEASTAPSPDAEVAKETGRRSLRKRKATAHPCGCDCQHHDHLSRLQQRSKKKRTEKKSAADVAAVSNVIDHGSTPVLTPIKNEPPDMTNKCPSPTPPTISPMHPLVMAPVLADTATVQDCRRKLHLSASIAQQSGELKKPSQTVVGVAEEEEEEEEDIIMKNEIKKQMLNLEHGADGRSTPTRFVSTPNGILYPVTPPKTPDNGGQGDQNSQLRRISEERDFIPLCCCKISGTNFINGTQVMYCQALDSIDGKVIGCCTKVTNHQLVRPAVKIPFMAICELHRARLVGHQCCPGCGHFCSQGKFLQCKKDSSAALHLFHKQCQVFKDSKYYCPHCGEESDQYEVLLQLNEPRGSSFFFGSEHKPQLKPRAKMSWGTTARRKSLDMKVAEDEEEEEVKDDQGVTVTLNKNITLSSGGLPPGPTRTQLEAAFAVLNGDKPKKARPGPKSLHHAAKINDLERLLGLIGEGIDPDTKYEDRDGETALHAAAAMGRAGIVHLLLQAGASPHIPDVALRTALMEAAENGNLECVKLLVKAGAVVNAKGEDGMSSLHLAAKAGNLDIFKFLLNTGRIEINIKDDGGWTPIIWAAEYDHLEIVKYILTNGGDPNIRDNEENTGLHWAAYAGSVDVAEYFLNAGCELESANERGDRPLHIAGRQNHYECVVLFLARGADSEARNNENDAPIACCADQNSQTWMALRVNRQLRGFATKRLKRPERLLHRDISMGRETNPIPVVNDADDENYPTDFQYMKENVETSPMNVNRVITSLQQCLCKDDCSSMFCVCSRNSVRCWYDKEGHLVKEFNQTEPPLLFECNRACRCWATCQNRVVQLGITCRLQVFRTNGRGWGVRTLLDIPAGTFVCEYVGEHISDAEADSREDDSYLFDLDNKDSDTFCVDARKYANVARFINHLCEPNLIPVKVFVEHQDLRFPHICFFSSRDIKAYEELGFDYGEKFWIIKWKQFTCECGSVKCKYSNTTIHQTIEDYNRRQMEEEAMEME